MSDRDFAAIATQYAQDVVDGRVVACKWVRLACRRHLRDLERAADGWVYQFNPELIDARTKKLFRPARRVCRFAEKLPHVKGDWAQRDELIRLEAWQIFILCSIFGWINTATGKRRFRIADVFVPRKNGKSMLAAVIGLYMLSLDGEHGAEVYSGATSRGQAMEVFKPALQMTRASPRFRADCGVMANASNLVVLDNNSKFEPLIGKPGDGASPSCAIVDEYHEHDSAELYDTMNTGMGARSQPLLLVITTAGTNIGGPCYVHQVELQKILEGVVENETRFGIIFGIDPDDDWTELATLVKANPNFGVSINVEYLEGMLRDAVSDPRKTNIFKTKHLNVWVAAASPWIDVAKLQACGDPTLNADDFKGLACHLGTDLASKIDIASKVKVFRRLEDDGRLHYYAFSRNYLPKARVQRPENSHYQGWVNEGMLTETPGNMIDLGYIKDAILEDAELHQVVEVGMDSWGSREIAPQLGDEGLIVVDVPMNVRNLSEPMKEINALIEDGRWHHDGNKATTWMFSNVEVEPDRNDNIFPRKASEEKKIDAAVATIIAVGRAMAGKTPAVSIYETRGVRTV